MITLHTSATPNGFRASIMLEESGLPYRVHAVDMKSGEHKSAAFLAINATGRLPAIVDDDAGQATPLALACSQNRAPLISTPRRLTVWRGGVIASGPAQK